MGELLAENSIASKIGINAPRAIDGKQPAFVKKLELLAKRDPLTGLIEISAVDVGLEKALDRGEQSQILRQVVRLIRLLCQNDANLASLFAQGEKVHIYLTNTNIGGTYNGRHYVAWEMAGIALNIGGTVYGLQQGMTSTAGKQIFKMTQTASSTTGTVANLCRNSDESVRQDQQTKNSLLKEDKNHSDSLKEKSRQLAEQLSQLWESVNRADHEAKTSFK
ncbi:MAG: hypothetical protein KDK40_02530 [Chlamydiia bacterium]|nr:hypothetical protein [Chlamydiia bacterium]